MQLFHLKHDLARLAIAFGKALLHLTADHVIDQPLFRQFAGGQGNHLFAITQDRYVICDAEKFLQLMGDVNAGNPMRLQNAENFHQLVNFGFGKSAGWLIQNQHLGIFG